jgi:hypothetical protein
MRYFRRAYQALTFSGYTTGAGLTVAPPHQGEPDTNSFQTQKAK